MTPAEFIQKWRVAELKERTASQSHFNDICRLLDIEDPITADPKGEWFTFEKGASKTGGGEGWADVWRKECFAWEYKGKKKDLDRAFAQLQQYAIALDNPPLLIVSDMDRFRVHTNWTNTVQEVHEFALDDLLDGATRDLLRNCFVDPKRLKPAKTRQMLTEEAAEEFSQLAQRLRSRGHEAHAVAHFVNRLVFCMFAEDVGLLPNRMFQRMLEINRTSPASFVEDAASLFAAMKGGGKVGFEKVEWFNGGLFDDDSVLPLERDDIENLITAAKLFWDEIDPSILGTLFERGLDPDKRSQLGAHYTDREKIMQIVEPVIIRPLTAEWEAIRVEIEAQIQRAEEARNRIPAKQSEAKKVHAAARRAEANALKKAKELHGTFVDRLRSFRVLDPACGSGNFLYLSLLALKDLEHLVNLEAEQLGLGRFSPTVGPESVYGIELNSYAAELARVSVWIGEIQWMRRNGFEAAKNPILRTLGNIENRDAVLVTDEHGNPVLDDEGKPQRASWPKANVVVGNPPFLGAYKMFEELGECYTVALRKAWPQVPGGADLVCYWFAGAWDHMVANNLERAGLVATNSIRGGANREVLKPVVKNGRIFEAWSDEEWTVDGAAVRVSLIGFDEAPDDGYSKLNGKDITRILSDLTSDTGHYDLANARKLKENLHICNRGIETGGPFELTDYEFEKLACLPSNPNGKKNSEVLRRIYNGVDIVKRSEPRFMIDFGADASEVEASLFQKPFEHLISAYEVYKEKAKSGKRKITIRGEWWLHRRTGAGLRKALEGNEKFIVTPRVAKHRVFVWMEDTALPDSAAYAIARDDDTTFGILHSHFHEIWSLRMGTFLGVGNDPRYTPSTTFETYPFPDGLTPDIPSADYADNARAKAIAAAAARLNELRENWLNPPELVDRVPEVVEGYPDRILPKDKATAEELKKRTLTNLYNARPAWLDHAHRALDEAVAEAYGWGEDFRAGLLTDDEILARLFRLNQERANV
ncbi:MAG: class I SAM-dependent DNA methyltransferase [Parasphingorhabdus sp.]